jgi:hypothetical protein
MVTASYISGLRKLSLGLLVFIINSSAIWASTRLDIQAKTLVDGKVEFKSGPCQPDPAPPAESQQMPETDTASYNVMVDLGRTTSGNYGYFVYEFHVSPKNTQAGGGACSFHVQGLPSGTFTDRIADVSFQVGENPPLEEGTIRLPLFNITYAKPILEYETSLSEVGLSGESSVEIGLTNTLPDLPVGLYKDLTVDSSPGLWQTHPQAQLQLPRSGSTLMQPGQKLNSGILLILRPNPWRALSTSIFPLAPDKSHETVTIYLNYDSPGGIQGTLEIPVSIRFKPSFWSLLFAVLAGGLIGALFSQMISAPKTKWYKAVLIAVIAALIAEAAGIVLVYAKSEFRLFGVELDPYQLLPALLCGVLVGMYGFRKTDDLLKVVKGG